MNQNFVTETCSNIRALARVSLQDKWKLSAIATAVYMLAISLPANILVNIIDNPIVALSMVVLYAMLVSAPFVLGYSMFCLNLFRKKECETAQVFYGFEKFFKAFGLYLMRIILIALWDIFAIIVVFMAFISHRFAYLFLAIPLMIPGIIAAYRYSQAFFIMADHPEYGIMQCIEESKRIMSGNKMKYFGLSLSFIGWAFLAAIPTEICNVIFGSGGIFLKYIGTIIGNIPYFWLVPYMYIANVAFYELATGNLRPGVIEVNGDTGVLEKSVVDLHKSEEENK